MSLDERMPDAPPQPREAQASAARERQPAHHNRLYCPVVGCPAGDATRAAGWSTFQSLRNHVQEHANGRLLGAIPPEWLEDNQLNQCTVCSKLLSRRFGDTCPRCRPALLQQVPRPSTGRPLPTDWPSLDDVLTTNIPTKAYVPKGAKRLWAQCLTVSLSQVVRYNDERAWLELLALPNMVLRAGFRGGKKNKRRNETDTRQRCQAWLDGHRVSLSLAPTLQGTSQRHPRARHTTARRAST